MSYPPSIEKALAYLQTVEIPGYYKKNNTHTQIPVAERYSPATFHIGGFYAKFHFWRY